MLGGLVMTHGDDLGLVLPPKLAPVQVVIVPIWESAQQRSLMLEIAGRVKGVLQRQLRVRVDDREAVNPGSKFYEWERKGVPIRLEIGPQEVSRQQVTIVRRFSEREEVRKRSRPEGEALATLPRTLNDMQRELYRAALDRRRENSHRGVGDHDRFMELLGEERGFVYAGWCGAEECEQRVKEETKATIRVLPDGEFQSEEEPETCVVCGAEAMTEAVWARAY